MRAIIDATGYQPELAPLLHHRPSPLLCVAGKPLIIHIIEFLVQQKVKTLELVLNYLPHRIESLLGNGERWGVLITYHLACEASRPFQAIRPFVRRFDGETVVFGSGDCLPEMGASSFQGEGSASFLFMDAEGVWTGWGMLSCSLFEKIPKDSAKEDLPSLLKGDYLEVDAKPFLSARTLVDLYDSNIRFLSTDRQQVIFPTTARCVERGVWISRGVSLHSTAVITPPVFIGEFCQINENAVVGPNAMIEDFCIIDEGSKVVNSLVCKNSYIGQDLNVYDSIVDRSLLISLSLNTYVAVRDGFMLSESYPRTSFSWLFGSLERLAAALLMLVFLPVYVIMLSRFPRHRANMLKLPANNNPLHWETFPWETFGPVAGREASPMCEFFFRLPLLKSVLRGDAHFVGVSPRTPEEAKQLPVDWRTLYLNSKVGIIDFSALEEKSGKMSDQRYASEAFYATQKGFFYDARLIFRWLMNKCEKK